jgi:DNA (cytosine-5)-methyltransferase 1
MTLEKHGHFATVEEVLNSLPALRSRLSKQQDSIDSWQTIVHENASYLLNNSQDVLLKREIEKAKEDMSLHTQIGSLRSPYKNNTLHNIPTKLDTWFSVNRPPVWLNHETRSHMASDLRRYLFASAFSKAYGYSPKGAEEFNIDGLRPEHKNWESGHFSDRFRVQIANRPSNTITSHMSKDGHYYIHYDSSQCRSLTVREAACFPDNFYFEEDGVYSPRNILNS